VVEISYPPEHPLSPSAYLFWEEVILKKRCPKCRHEVKTSYNYCPNCGHKPKDMMEEDLKEECNYQG